MKTFNQTERIAHEQRHPRKPILFWQAKQNGKVIDENNSLPLLRHKYGAGVTYHSVR